MEKYFNKVSGKNNFYDFDNKLNYFEYFDINKTDLENVFLLLKKYENNMHALKENIENKIQERFVYYSTHIYNLNSKTFNPIQKKEDFIITKSFFVSLIFLAARLISQEYIMLSTINKLIYNVDLSVCKFNNEKYSYKIYKKSLKEFYETLTSFGLYFLNCQEKQINILSNMDSYLEKNIYNLPLYKDIFLYFWMYTYIKNSCDLSDYQFKYDQSKRVYPLINNNVLSPMDYDHFFDGNNLEEENTRIKMLVENFRNWSIESYYISIENKICEYYKKIYLINQVSLNDYFELANYIQDVFVNKSILNFKDLCEEVLTEIALKDEKTYTHEEINFVIQYISFNKKNEEMYGKKVDDYYNQIYKTPIFEFKNKNNEILVFAFPEFVWMAYHMQRDFHFFDKSLSKQFNTMLKEDYHNILNDLLLKVEKRFKVIKTIDAKNIILFSETKAKKVIEKNIFLNSIIFDPSSYRLLFAITNFYSSENIDWLNAKRTIDTYSDHSKIIQKMFFPIFNGLENELPKIAKQLKKLNIPIDKIDNLKIEGIAFINDILYGDSKIKVCGYDVNIVGISTMEYFLTSFMYKK